jgi:chromosome segregation ATPase
VEDVMTKLQKDHLMILLESIDSKVQVTMESVSRLDNKIDAVRDELKEDIAVLDCKIMGLSKRVDSVEKNLSDRIDAVDKKVDAVDMKVDSVYKELVAHRNDTEQHRSQPKRPVKRVA